MPTSWIVVPLHGLRLSDTGTPTDGFLTKPWSLASRAQIPLVGELSRDSESLRGNIAMVQSRLNPEVLLLYAFSDELSPHRVFSAYDDAETVIGALNLLSLLTARPDKTNYLDEPFPVFRARYKEHCDLPIAIDHDRLWLAGHSSFLWFNVADAHGAPNTSTAQLQGACAQAHVVVQRAYSGLAQPTELTRQLEASMRALTGAFQATHVGQFVAASVSALELLLGSNWKNFEARLRTLVGPQYEQRLSQVLDARHDFVHKAKQPAVWHSVDVGHVSLAVAIQAWAIVAELSDELSTLRELWRALDKAPTGPMPPGPVTFVMWVHKYLQ